MTKNVAPACIAPRLGIALAARALELSAPGADKMLEMQFTPAGKFLPRDDRKLDVR
jgi:hypothetical protein